MKEHPVMPANEMKQPGAPLDCYFLENYACLQPYG